MSQRLHHIDVAKGISIILVVANHSAFRAVAPEFFVATSSLRLPLFFFLSGIFFSIKWPPGEFTLRKADALLKPYFLTLFVLWLLDIVFLTPAEFGLSGIFYASGMTISLMPIWFLPHLFLVHVTSYFVVRMLPSLTLRVETVVVLAFVIFLLGAGVILMLDITALQVRNIEDARVGLPFSADVLLMSLSFFLAGVYLKRQVINLTPISVLAWLFVLIYLVANVLGSPYLDFNGRIIKQSWLVFLCAGMGIYIVLSISYWLVRFDAVRQFLVEVGQAGLIILVFHSFFVGSLYRFLLPQLKEQPLLHGVSVVVIFVLGVLGPLWIRELIVRLSWLRALYLPLPFTRFSSHKKSP